MATINTGQIATSGNPLNPTSGLSGANNVFGVTGTTDILGTSWSNPTGPNGIWTRLVGTAPTLNTFQNLNPQQQASLQALLGQMGTGQAPAYGGQLSAPTNALQGTSLAAMEQAALGAATPTAGGYGMGGTSGASAAALTDVMNQQPQDLTSYFQSTIVDPAMQAYQQQVLPQLQRQFSGISGFGSDKQTAEGIAAGNLATGIASAMGTASQNALQQQQANKIAAAQGLSGVGATDINNLLNLQAGGGAAQAVAQQPLTAQYNAYQAQQAQQSQNINQLLQALGIQTQTPVVQAGSPGLFGGSGGSAIGSIVGKFL